MSEKPRGWRDSAAQFFTATDLGYAEPVLGGLSAYVRDEQRRPVKIRIPQRGEFWRSDDEVYLVDHEDCLVSLRHGFIYPGAVESAMAQHIRPDDDLKRRLG